MNEEVNYQMMGRAVLVMNNIMRHTILYVLYRTFKTLVVVLSIKTPIQATNINYVCNNYTV